MVTPLVAILISASSWNTNCAQTQAEGKQGYTVDQVIFSGDTPSVEFVREWHKDAACADTAFDRESTKGTANFSTEVSQRFNQNGETAYEADFILGSKTELGMLSLSSDQKTIRIARGFGQFRNTMLSLIAYTAQKK